VASSQSSACTAFKKSMNRTASPADTGAHPSASCPAARRFDRCCLSPAAPLRFKLTGSGVLSPVAASPCTACEQTDSERHRVRGVSAVPAAPAEPSAGCVKDVWTFEAAVLINEKGAQSGGGGGPAPFVCWKGRLVSGAKIQPTTRGYSVWSRLNIRAVRGVTVGGAGLRERQEVFSSLRRTRNRGPPEHAQRAT
jgi:hypothetical protein